MPEEGFPGCSGVVTNTNLFWRDKQLNRKDDNLAFKLIQEVRALNESKEEASKWRATWIALLISTKHEGKGSVCRRAARSGQMDQLIGPSRYSNWMSFGNKGD